MMKLYFVNALLNVISWNCRRSRAWTRQPPVISVSAQREKLYFVSSNDSCLHIWHAPRFLVLRSPFSSSIVVHSLKVRLPGVLQRVRSLPAQFSQINQRTFYRNWVHFPAVYKGPHLFLRVAGSRWKGSLLATTPPSPKKTYFSAFASECGSLVTLRRICAQD